VLSGNWSDPRRELPTVVEGPVHPQSPPPRRLQSLAQPELGTQTRGKRSSSSNFTTVAHPGDRFSASVPARSSQRQRKPIEELFGWMKVIGLLKEVKLWGLDEMGWLPAPP